MPTIRFALAGMSVLAATLQIADASAHARRQATPGGVEITFLANEGVLLSDGKRKVIIDGLFQKYKTYAVPHDSIQQKLSGAQTPFDSVDLILVTHHHGDHFHPAPVVAHLQANPRAKLVTSSQVIDSLRGRVPRGAKVGAQLLARTTPPGQRRREVINGIPVEILGIAHGGNPAVEHLGYIVDIGGRRVLHIGDVDGTEADFAAFRLDTARIDVALVPMWMTMEAPRRATIEKWIRPRQTVAFHLGGRDTESVVLAVQAAMPGAVAFLRSMDTRTW